MRSIRSIILAFFLPMLLVAAALAQETLLQNDRYVDGQSVGFQGGFIAGKMAGSMRLVR